MARIALNWIDGEWQTPGNISQSFNPANGEVVGEFADGGRAEADAGIASARRAFRATSWGRDRALRHKVLAELADRFDDQAEALARLLSSENGKTLFEARLEAGLASRTLRYGASQALTSTGISAEVQPGTFFSTLAEPAGVVAVIVPWNAPVVLFIRSLAPALAAGNAVVAKLPAQTALTNALVSEIIASVADLPKGIVNIFTESGNTGAPRLVDSPDVDVVSYTGSVSVGKRVGAAAGATLKRVNQAARSVPCVRRAADPGPGVGRGGAYPCGHRTRVCRRVGQRLLRARHGRHCHLLRHRRVPAVLGPG
jgi:betaine-aldehyde dehydrogenase